MINRIYSLAAAVALVLLSMSTAYAEARLKIGWIGPLTGPAAVLGVDSVPAARIAIDMLGGQDVELLVEDDQYSTPLAVTAYQRLVHEKGVRVIITLTYGALFALAETAERDGVLLLDPLDCDEHIAALPNSVICISKPTETLARANAETALKAGDLPAGIIYFHGDPFMGIAAEATEARLEEAGQHFAFKQGYGNDTVDFRALLLRAQAAKVKSLFLYGYDNLAIAMKQARQAGFKGRFYAFATVNSPTFRTVAGKALEGTRAPLWRAPRTAAFQQFIAAFEKKVGRAPEFEISTIPTFDIVTLLVSALRPSAPDGKPEVENIDALKEFFLSLKDYQGLSGNITVDRDGVTRSFPAAMYEFRSGEFVPASASVDEAVLR